MCGNTEFTVVEALREKGAVVYQCTKCTIFPSVLIRSNPRSSEGVKLYAHTIMKFRNAVVAFIQPATEPELVQLSYMQKVANEMCGMGPKEVAKCVDFFSAGDNPVLIKKQVRTNSQENSGWKNIYEIKPKEGPEAVPLLSSVSGVWNS